MSGTTNVNWSAAAAAFDRVADSYDDLFTRTAIGQAQRKQVWRRLLRAFAPGERVLELNCGTGEDARFLALRGRRIVACDASARMIEIAAARTQQEAKGADITFLRIPNEDLGELSRKKLFDSAYSNFSGLNCMDDLQPVARNLSSLVRPGGRVLLCLWSRVCVGELVWYLMQGQARKAFRRFSGRATARLGESIITVSYPTVGDVQRFFAPWFVLERRSAIGLFVPPSYVEGWARKHETTLGHLDKMDRVFARLPVFRDVGDHVLLEFKRCSH
jgi:SAM-dependent methyltransferase